MAQEKEREWHPIEDIRSLAESMCRAFDGSGGPRGRGKGPEYRAPERQVVLKENDEGFVVTLELPEVSKKDLHLNVAENSVTIFAEWSKEIKAKDRVERIRQTYSRLLHLPASVKADKARATFKDRVLKIFLPRAKPSQVRRIEVK